MKNSSLCITILQVLTVGELHSYATTVHQNEELITSLYCLLESLPSLEVII